MVAVAAIAVTLPTFVPAFAYREAVALPAAFTALPVQTVAAALNGNPPQTTLPPPVIATDVVPFNVPATMTTLPILV